MNKIFLIMALAAMVFSGRLEAQDYKSQLRLERIPGETEYFNTMELIRVDKADSPYHVNQVINLWNGSDSSAHRVTITNIQPDNSNKYWPKLVIEYNEKLKNSGDTLAHICPMPGFSFSMSRSVDRRGHTYQLASTSAFPSQQWKCIELSKTEIDELRQAVDVFSSPAKVDVIGRSVDFSDNGSTGFTKIVSGKGSIIFQVSDMSYPCRTIFMEKSKGKLTVIKDTSDCNMEPFIDIDGDGMPEFLLPFSDSADAGLEQVFPVEKALASYSTGQ
jgi:hypothetical protein